MKQFYRIAEGVHIGSSLTAETIERAKSFYRKSEVINDFVREGDRLLLVVGTFKRKPAVETPIPFAAGQIVKTRKGHAVRIVCTNRMQNGLPLHYPIVGLELSDGMENIRTYDMRGQYGGHTSEYDLVPLTQKSEEIIELVLDDPS